MWRNVSARQRDRGGRQCRFLFTRNQLLPPFQDKVMARKATREVRARVCADLAGEVVEMGFGTGLNARYYPPTVT
jgi:hypothetical protein